MRFAASAVLGLVLAFPAAAAAAEPAPIGRARMAADMHRYFASEKTGGYGFTTAGLGAMVAGSLLLEEGSRVSVGAAIPLLSVSVIQMAAGIVLEARTDAQVATLDALLATTPAELKAVEAKRMKRVVLQFLALEVVEATLFAGGAGMAVAGGLLDRDTLLGVGVGLAVQGGVMFVLDYLAHRRASRYLDSLRRFDPAL